MPRRLILFYCIAASLSLVARSEDEVEYTNDAGKKQSAKGTIKEETPDQIVITTPKGDANIPVYQIEQVRYDKQPANLVSARSKERQGKFEQAIEDYKEIGKSLGDTSPRLASSVAFGVFRASAELAIRDPSKSEAPLTWYQKYSGEFSSSRYYYPMQELIGRIYLQRSEFDKAASALKPLEKLDWPGYREKATLYRGMISLKQKKPAEAVAAFDEVIASSTKNAVAEEARFAASVRKGEALLMDKKPAEAEKLLRQVLSEVPREFTQIKAAGHNALGDSLAELKRHPKESLLDGYLWVIVLYNNDSEELARALFHASKIFAGLGQTERSQSAQSRLRSEFPQSPWTKMLAGP